jgi:hypothetical protein
MNEELTPQSSDNYFYSISDGDFRFEVFYSE